MPDIQAPRFMLHFACAKSMQRESLVSSENEEHLSSSAQRSEHTSTLLVDAITS